MAPDTVREASTWSGWIRHVWLVYLVFFVLPLFLQPTRGWQWVVHGAAIAAFFWLYGRAQRVSGAALACSVGGIFGLGVVLLPINPGAMCLFMYAVALLDRVRRPAVAAVSLAILLAVAAAAILRFGSTPMLGMLVLMLLVGVTRIHDGVVERKNRELQRSRDEIEQLAALAERERIGRDLHDLLGHTLSVIVLKSELAAKMAEADPARSVTEIREVERISREALADVRAAVSGCRARGLPGELDNARRVLAGVGVEMSSAMDPVEVTAVQESALSLALREAVTNVVRHARARRCAVRLWRDGDRIRLDVEDDGVGGVPNGGNGLAGMRARIFELGGTVEHDGRAGWHLAVSIPAGAIAAPVPPAPSLAATVAP